MRTINASEEAYKRILKSKQMMETISDKVVPMSEALDAMLGVKVDV